MSTQSGNQRYETTLGDGRLHPLPCSSPEHEGEPGDHDLLVRYTANVAGPGAPHGVWQLRCWTGQCSYESIAESLRIELPRVRSNLERRLPYLAAIHDNDQDGRARLAFHVSWPALHPGQPDSCDWPDCEDPTEWGHHHESVRGKVRGTQVALWGADTSGTTLVVVGGAEDAALLYRAGLHSQYTPVTWYEARANYRQGSITDCDWSAVSGREVIIWLDDDSVASGRVDLVASKVTETGAASVHAVDSSAQIGDDSSKVLNALKVSRAFEAGGGTPRGQGDHRGNDERISEVRQEHGPDSLTATGEEEVNRICLEPVPHDPAATEDRTCEDGQESVPDDLTATDGEVTEDHQAADPADLISGPELLSTGPQFATDVGVAMRFLRDDEGGLVGASDPTGQADDYIYREDECGLLNPMNDHDLAALLIRSQRQYLAEARGTSPLGLSPTQVDYARLMASERAPGLVRRNLRPAFLAMKDCGVAPLGYRQVSIADIDGDFRYLGAPNGVVDLSTGSLLTGRRAADALVYRTISDQYVPDATHPDIDALVGGIVAEDRVLLLNALGAALLGMVGGRVYLVIGCESDAAGHLLAVVQTALGGDYVGKLPIGSLTDRYPSKVVPVRGPASPRLIVGRAPARGGKLEIDLGVHLTVSDAIRSRALPMEAGTCRATTTMFLAVRPSLVKTGMVADDALMNQLHVLRCADTGRGMDTNARERVIGDPRARQALVAMLVKNCVTDSVHTDVPTLGLYLKGARGASPMTAKQWITHHVIVTGDAGDRLSSTSLWDAARADPTSGQETDSAWGLTRRRFTALVRTVLDLNPPTSIRDGGDVIHGWQGVRLDTDRS